MNKKELKDKFFKEHTYKCENGIPLVCTHPHILFEWMYKQLTLNVVINWVACKDKLPNDGYVLIYEKGIGIRTAHYESKKNKFWHNSFYNPTHWAELPEPPCL
jgi:hypothetical protein